MRRSTRWVVPGGLALALLLGAAGPRGRADEKKEGTKVTLGGLTSTAPAAWKEENIPPRLRQFRAKQFALPKVGKDKKDAELIIYYFGEGGGGPAKANVERWKTFFVPPKGKTLDEAAKVEQFKVAGHPVTYLDIEGTYKYKSAPFDPNAKVELLPDYRMLGVVLETAKGPYYLRLVGPAATVTHYKKGFDQFLKSFK